MSDKCCYTIVIAITAARKDTSPKFAKQNSKKTPSTASTKTVEKTSHHVDASDEGPGYEYVLNVL